MRSMRDSHESQTKSQKTKERFHKQKGGSNGDGLPQKMELSITS